MVCLATLVSAASVLNDLLPSPPPAARYTIHVPVYDFTAAAGFLAPRSVPEEIGWTEVPGGKLKVYFYSHEMNEPAHVHVDRDAASCKFWLSPWPSPVTLDFGHTSCERSNG